MRIALLDCYLQNGLSHPAEMEAAARFIAAAKRAHIEAAVFARSEELEEYAPDFVVALSYHDPKLTRFPTYGLLTAPMKWVEGLARFRRNLLSYDGYCTMATKTARFVEDLCARAGKPVVQAACTISLPRTAFVPRDFANAWAVYIGANWDGPRHAEAFRALAQTGAAKFHGPRARWSYLPESAFGGEVPFDGAAALATYGTAGIGLCLNHADFDAEGLSSNRMFEIPAASAVMIAGRNQAIVEAYGDAALYVDWRAAAPALAEEIRAHVAWVRAHPNAALERAEQCHRIFNERYSMETMFQRILVLHRDACRRMGFERATALAEERQCPAFDLTLLVHVRDATKPFLHRCLDSIRAQTLPARDVVILDGTVAGLSEAAVGGPGDAPSRVVRASPSPNSARRLREAAEHASGQWLACLSAEDALYPNHVFALAHAARGPGEGQGATRPALVYSGMSQVSGEDQLAEVMRDDYQVPRSERMRLVQFPLDAAGDASPHLSTCAIRLDRLRGRLRSRTLQRLLPFAGGDPLRDLAREGPVAFTGMVTVAAHGAITRPERLPGMR